MGMLSSAHVMEPERSSVSGLSLFCYLSVLIIWSRIFDFFFPGSLFGIPDYI